MPTIVINYFIVPNYFNVQGASVFLKLLFNGKTEF
jgi:hypothetical protein